MSNFSGIFLKQDWPSRDLLRLLGSLSHPFFLGIIPVDFPVPHFSFIFCFGNIPTSDIEKLAENLVEISVEKSVENLVEYMVENPVEKNLSKNRSKNWSKILSKIWSKINVENLVEKLV